MKLAEVKASLEKISAKLKKIQGDESPPSPSPSPANQSVATPKDAVILAPNENRKPAKGTTKKKKVKTERSPDRVTKKNLPKAAGSPPSQKVEVVSSTEETAEIEQKEIGPQPAVETRTKRTMPEVELETKMAGKKWGGFYFLPFIGMQAESDLDWEKIAGGTSEIRESKGVSAGIRVGYDWKHFFADFQLSHFQNEMHSINLPVEFTGESYGLGMHLSGGGRVHVNEISSCFLGVGIGGVEQNLSFSMAGTPVEESDFLLSFQLFAGLEFRPTDHMRVGLRYRWLRIEEMRRFSERQLHLAELSLGYVF